MAEAITLVCDLCGKPEATTVTMRVNGRNLQKDYCSKHLAELVQEARSPKRGRRRGSVAKTSTPRNRVARKAPARKKAATRKRSAATRKKQSSGARACCRD
jgi:hypothetical protein